MKEGRGGERDRKKKGERKESWVGEGRRECSKKEEEGKGETGWGWQRRGVRHKKGCGKRKRKKE